MNAGRELDTLIAEKVMGWERLPHPHPEIDAAGGMWRTPRGPRMCPKFSAGISAAWEVVEHITRSPATLEEADRAANTRFGFWWRDANLWAYSSAEAAHAICLAALKAIGYEEVSL